MPRTLKSETGPKQVRNRSETALKRLNLESFPSPSLTRRGWLLSDHVKAFRTDSGPQRLGLACILNASFRTVANLSGPIPDRFRTASVAFSLYFDCFFSDRCRTFRTNSGPRVLRLACILTASCRTVAELSRPIPDRFRTDSGPRVLRLACILTASCRTVVDLSGPIPDRKGRI